MADTITVWVTEHDDPEVLFVINTRSDMEGNFDDLLDEGRGVDIEIFGETFSYDASRVLKMVDPIAYEQEFMRYCQGWTEMDMPLDVYLSDDENAGRDWVEAQLTRQA